MIKQNTTSLTKTKTLILLAGRISSRIKTSKSGTGLSKKVYFKEQASCY